MRPGNLLTDKIPHKILLSEPIFKNESEKVIKYQGQFAIGQFAIAIAGPGIKSCASANENNFKVNKSVYIRHDIKLNNFFLHVPNHALKE